MIGLTGITAVAGLASRNDFYNCVVDTTPPEITAAFVPIGEEGRVRVEYTVDDNCDPEPYINAFLRLCRKKISVENGQLIVFDHDGIEGGEEECEFEWRGGRLYYVAPKVKLVVKAKDACGNEKRVRRTYRPPNDND